jgi:hypothetical protein
MDVKALLVLLSRNIGIWRSVQASCVGRMTENAKQHDGPE